MRIAITGKMRSGKDTFADYFIIQKAFTKLAFGDGITEVIKMYFPDAFNDGKPREHYQVIGQTFRQFDPNVWVNVLDSRLTNATLFFGKSLPVIVTDCRQLNEYEYLKGQGFTVVKVETADELRIERMKANGEDVSPSLLNHGTELEVDNIPYDYLVTNNGTRLELLEQAAFIHDELWGEYLDLQGD